MSFVNLMMIMKSCWKDCARYQYIDHSGIYKRKHLRLIVYQLNMNAWPPRAAYSMGITVSTKSKSIPQSYSTDIIMSIVQNSTIKGQIAVIGLWGSHQEIEKQGAGDLIREWERGGGVNISLISAFINFQTMYLWVKVTWKINKFNSCEMNKLRTNSENVYKIYKYNTRYIRFYAIIPGAIYYKIEPLKFQHCRCKEGRVVEVLKIVLSFFISIVE